MSGADKILTFDPARVRAEIARARASADARRFEEAKGPIAVAFGILSNANVSLIKNDLDFLSLWEELGAVAARAQDHDSAAEARRALLQWIEGGAPAPRARVHSNKIAFAQSLAHIGKFNEAERVLREEIVMIESGAAVEPAGLPTARARLGGVFALRRRFQEARELLEEAILTLSHSPDPPRRELAIAHNFLGAVFDAEGYLQKSEESFRASLQYLEEEARVNGAAPDFDIFSTERFRLVILHNLSSAMRRRGDARGAARIAATVFDSYKSYALPGETRDLWAGLNLSLAKCECGDQDGARAALAAVRERIAALTLEERPDAFRLKLHLACNLAEAGEAGLSEICIEELAGHARGKLNDNDPERALLQQIHGAILRRNGRLGRALELMEPLLANVTDAGSGVPLRFLNLLLETGACYHDSGNLQKAASARRAAAAALEQLLPGEHPDVARGRRALATTLAALGEWPEFTKIFIKITDGVSARLERALLLSPREAEAAARAAGDDVSFLLEYDLLRPAEPDLTETIFDIIEARRAAGSFENEAARAIYEDSELLKLQETAAARRARLADAAARVRDPELSMAGIDAAGILQIAAERDAAETVLLQKLSERGLSPRTVAAEELKTKIRGDAAILSYHRYHSNGGIRFAAHVLRGGGDVARFELGPVETIQKAAADWRAELFTDGEMQQNAGAARGIGALRGPSAALQKNAGEILRTLILDPLLPAVGDARILYILPDGELHQIPFDALPAGGEYLGDRARVLLETSVAGILRAENAPPVLKSNIQFLGLGGADFGKAKNNSAGLPPFEALPASLEETLAIADMIQKRGGAEITILKDKNATKKALREAAASASILHIATHAFSLSETADAAAETGLAPRDVERYLLQFSPMALRGLALAGANESAEGILTAEELAFFNMRNIKLAVLSACETHVAVTGTGPSIPSLRAAVHSAGARASVASLWRVPDALARDFMGELYHRWLAGEPLASALWGAKRALSSRGVPPRFWAAWVATGDGGD